MLNGKLELCIGAPLGEADAVGPDIGKVDEVEEDEEFNCDGVDGDVLVEDIAEDVRGVGTAARTKLEDLGERAAPSERVLELLAPLSNLQLFRCSPRQ